MFICMYECIRDGFVNVAASDDQWKLKHYWVLPTGLQNRPQWQAAGVGGCGSHPLHWWGKNSPPHPEKMLLKACDWLIVGLFVCVCVCFKFSEMFTGSHGPLQPKADKRGKSQEWPHRVRCLHPWQWGRLHVSVVSAADVSRHHPLSRQVQTVTEPLMHVFPWLSHQNKCKYIQVNKCLAWTRCDQILLLIDQMCKGVWIVVSSLAWYSPWDPKKD